MASGDFIALMDHDDEIASNALLENARLLNQHPDADMIYSDEDKINENGLRFKPLFKPEWSPDTFLSQMYSGHLGVYRRNLVKRVGGFKKTYSENANVPRPENWSGWILEPTMIEFWLKGQNRIHERLRYYKELNNWIKKLLNP